MVYLEENNFKNHLISSAKGDWFVKGKTYEHSDILKSDGSSRHSNLPLIGTKVKDFKGKEVVNFSVHENKNNKLLVKLSNDNSLWETNYSSHHGSSWDKVFREVCSWSNECYERITWKDINQNFTLGLQQNWEDKGLNYEQCKEWINVGLKVDDYDFAAYLTEKDYQSQDNFNLEELREEYSAKQWFEKSYPRNDREQITELDISKKSLKGELDLSNFTKLEQLNCSNNNLTKIIISPSSKEKLKVIIFDNNNSLGKDSTLEYFSKFANLETLKINATSFSGSLKPLKNLTKLQKLEIGGTDIDSGLEFLPESVEELSTDSNGFYSNPLNPAPKVNKIGEQLAPYGHNLKTWRKEGIKIILLIGRSGRGKSTLANVITGMENKFKESSSSISETKKIQVEQFLENNINYLIIDTPGIGDTKMSDNEVLDIIAEAVYLAKDGLSQVLFTVGGRFDQYEMATYDLLRTIIFDEHITKHTTVIRTRFEKFKSGVKCKEDIKAMTEEATKRKTELIEKITNKEEELKEISSSSEKHQNLAKEIEQLRKESVATNLAEIIESCEEKVIHVDNPPVGIKGISDSESNLNKKKRIKSREKILEHLKKTCQETSYRPAKLQKLSQDIAEDMDNLLQSRKELEKEMEKLKTSSRSSSADTSPLKVENNNKLKNLPTPNNSVESTVEEEKTENKQEFTTESNLAVGKIKELEDRKAKLKREIEKKEKVIRQKVLKHIFNNYKEIKNELGGDIFMENVVGEHEWEKISPEFKNKELILKWLNEKFDYKQIEKWATALGNSFKPKDDAGFCAWLRDTKHLTVEEIKELDYPRNIKKLRGEYIQLLEQEVNVLDKRYQKLSSKEEKDWSIIHQEFTFNLQQEWEEKGFDYETAKEWTSVGLQPTDADYAEWLRDKLKKTPEDVLNYDSRKILWEQYIDHLESNNKDSSDLVTEFLKANLGISKESVYQLKGYLYHFDREKGMNIVQNPHLPTCKLEGNVSDSLSHLLFKKNEVVFFRTKDKLNKSDSFAFSGTDGYYWTIFPKEDLAKKKVIKKWISWDYSKKSPWKRMSKELTKKRVSTDEYVEGYSNMDHLYLSATVGFERLAEIRLIIESHDQGWSSYPEDDGKHDTGHSWGEIGVLDFEDKEKVPRMNIYTNTQASSEWQTHTRVITDHFFLNQIKKGDKIGIWLRSRYPGWENYAKSGEIELIEEEAINLPLPLKDIPSKYWDKVEVGNDWDQEYYKKNNEGRGWEWKGEIPMMDSYPGSQCDKRFKNQKILNGFKKYSNGNEKFLKLRNADNNETEVPIPLIKDIKVNDYFYFHDYDIVSRWYYAPARLTKFLRDANKLFVKDGYGKITSQEAFEFLQSIIESREIMATIKLTQEAFEQFKQENQQLQTQVQIPLK